VEPVGHHLVGLRQDYYMVTPSAMTFWGHPKIGSFQAPEEGEGWDGWMEACTDRYTYA